MVSTSSTDDAAPVPRFLHALVDDGAIFPPRRAALEDAVTQHLEHRASTYSDLLGGLVVPDTVVADLSALTAEQEEAPLELNLVVTGGAGAIEPAVTWVSRAPSLSLRAVEFALRDEEDLAHNARRLVSVVDSIADEIEGVVVYAEPPTLRDEPSSGWLAALDELAAREIHLKLRDVDASGIEAALDRELPFKCVGDVDHTFLQVLVATRASLDGTPVADALGQASPGSAARLLADPEVAARTRRWFESFTAADVLEVHEELVDLGLLA